MKKEISENINEPVVYLAKEKKSNKISPIWILPLIILGILAFIAYDTYSKKGTNIVVYFKSAEGLKENVTTLEYKGLALGKVTKISMHDDLKNVAVNILVNSDVAKYVANEGSKFWIKKPTVSLTKISGLSTLISGYKIELSPNFKIENAKPQWYFTGLDSAPDDEFEENGYYISLLLNDKDNVDVGTPIFYNKYQIGEIVSKEFKNEQLYASAYIYDKYNYLVNKSSKFIMNEALKVNYGASGLNIEVSSLYSALVGGITVVTSIKDDSKIEKNEIYTLFSSKDDLRKKVHFTIDFNEGKIDENTSILYKGIEIGKVSNVKIQDDILATKAYVYEEYKYLLTKNSRFIIEEPTISFDGIKNLGNIIKGNYLSLDYQEGEFSNKFLGISKKDLKKSLNAIKVDLISDNLNSINERSKIYYKNIEIGRVESYRLSDDYKNVRISILIDDKYKDLINNSSKFYDMSSKLLEIKNFDININYSGVEKTLNGGIALVSNLDNTKLTKKEFELFDSYKEIQKEKRDKSNGFIVYSQFDNSFVLKEDMAIVYKNQEIGFVKKINFDDKNSKVELFVYEDFKKFITFHNEHKAWASLIAHPNGHPYDSSLLVTEIAEPTELGGMPTETHKLIRWISKEDKNFYYKNRVNAGIEIISPNLLHETIKTFVPRNPNVPDKVDLDLDVLKKNINSGKIYIYDTPEYIKDMGTPDRYYETEKDIIRGRVRSRNLKNKQKAIFLDRDGTINKYVGFITKPEQFELLSGVTEAIKSINRSGYLAIVITNQPVIARGICTFKDLQVIHNKMETELGKAGAFVDGIYICPHHTDKGFVGERPDYKFDCSCRKPKPGLFFQAAKDFNIDLSESYMIGDSLSDQEAGINAKCKKAVRIECNKVNGLLESLKSILDKSYDIN